MGGRKMHTYQETNNKLARPEGIPSRSFILILMKSGEEKYVGHAQKIK
jgi:hypothetical protein